MAREVKRQERSNWVDASDSAVSFRRDSLRSRSSSADAGVDKIPPSLRALRGIPARKDVITQFHNRPWE
jgi:hypothetical protein